jgi:hypothetical protein
MGKKGRDSKDQVSRKIVFLSVIFTNQRSDWTIKLIINNNVRLLCADAIAILLS